MSAATTPATGRGTRPKLAVWKFASCDGCQLTLLDCEEELMAVADRVEIAYFLEASSAPVEGPYDVSLVEGSITTAEDIERIHRVREQSTTLVTIGACATAGGIQALRNFGDVEELMRIVYATPQFIDTLDTSTPISDHVTVDFELRGCPIDKRQLLEVLGASLVGRAPVIEDHRICVECKQRGNPCILVTDGTPCLGPVTQSGCGALCPTFGRGCYGCFGPAEQANVASMRNLLEDLGVPEDDIRRLFHTFNSWSPEFRAAPTPVPTPTRRRP